MRLFAIAALLVSALCISSAAAAPPEATTCDGTVLGGVHHGVLVPAGATCNLSQAKVIGDIDVGSGGFLNAVDNRVTGDVVGDHALIVQFRNAVLRGSIDIVGAGDSPSGMTEVFVDEVKVVNGDIRVTESAGTILVEHSQLTGGDIVVTDNFVPPFLAFPSQLSVRNNEVRGNVTVSRNSGPGFKDTNSNQVRGVLRCEQNDLPFEGGPNQADTVVGDCF